MKRVWEPLIHPEIVPGYQISNDGFIKFKSSDSEYSAEYFSSNGYNYAIFIVKEKYWIDNNPKKLFPIDDIIAMAFIPIPEHLKNKKVKVIHINNNTHDNSLSNLKWIEDVEEWKIISDPDVLCNEYEISNWGNVRAINNGHLSKSTKIYRYATFDGSYFSSIQKGINRLVASEFILGWNKYRSIVNHIDGDKCNNYWKNLEWVTYSENSRHGYYVGLNKILLGSESPFSKITEDIAKKIWLLLIDDPTELNGREPTNGSPTKVCDYIKNEHPEVTIGIVSNIKRDKKWGNISFEGDCNKLILNEDIAKKIWLLLIDDPIELNGREPTNGSGAKVQQYLLEDGYDITRMKIYTIKNGWAWKSITDKLTQPKTPLKKLSTVITEDNAKKIWLLLIDDPTELNGREPTNGSPTKVINYLKDTIPFINEGIVDAIKHGAAWNKVTGLPKRSRN